MNFLKKIVRVIVCTITFPFVLVVFLALFPVWLPGVISDLVAWAWDL